MQAGGENLDVILGDVIWTAQLAESDWISDLSDRFTESQRKEYLPGSVEAITYEGKTFGMPWFTDTGLLYYRKDLLQESGFDGPPKTWDELKQMTLKVREDAGLKYGFVFQGAAYEGGVCDGMEFIWTHGGEVLDPDDPTRVLVDSPEAIAGLATERSMITERISPEAVTVYKEDESAGAFLNGDAVFLRNWPYVYSLVGTSDYPKLRPDQVGVSELPSADGEPGSGTVGDQPLYISSSAKDPDAAWKFIQFLTAPSSRSCGLSKAPTCRHGRPSTTTPRFRRTFRSSRSPKWRSSTPGRARSPRTTRICPWRWPSSSTPRSPATSRLRKRRGP
jgi:multiple sugar transport system substrate-binding protein